LEIADLESNMDFGFDFIITDDL